MDVTSELLDTFEFRKKGRGYDPEQVDELIAGVRSTLGDLEARLADADARAEAAEARAADAEVHARTSSESDETIQRTLLLAQRTADAAVQEAEEAAARKMAEAEAHAGRLVEGADEARARALANAEEEVRRSVEDSRTRLTQEIGALEQIRNTLMADVEHLEEHIEIERGRLRSSSDALTDLLSRSDRLGQVELPELSDIDPMTKPGAGPAPDATALDQPIGGRPEDESGPPSPPEPPPAQEPVDDLGWSSDAADAASATRDLRSPAPEDTVPAEDDVSPEDTVPAEDDVSPATGLDGVDAPPPPPPPPTFDDDLGPTIEEPPPPTFDDDLGPTIEEPPPPPPPPGDEPSSEGQGEELSGDAFEGLDSVTGDLDPGDPEDNAWLAELADDDEAESAGAGEGQRRRFGRRR
jgi:DivIVA domain-containing protein